MTRKLTFLTLGLGAMAALLTCGCGDSGPTAPTVVPTVEPTPPPPPPPANRAPVVFVRGGGQSCHPALTLTGVTPCLLRLTAYAQDPDGDPLTYAWSGCAAGEQPGADCVVNAIRPFTATVKVSDGRGGVVASSVELTGVNRAPVITLPGAPVYLPTDSDVELYGELDDDDPVCGPDLFFMDVDAQGTCGPRVRLDCRGLERVVMIHVGTHNPGTCNLSVSLRDAWGRASEALFSFEVERR